MADKVKVPDARGSVWHRWDPHVHAPGTLRNDRYTGANPWEDFLKKIETADPPIRALGVTDYLDLSCYQRVLDEKKKGRLDGVELIFPNIEMRFSIETAKGSGVNVHILASPEDPEHIEQLKRLLSGLSFTFQNEKYRCTRDDLIRLGRAYDKALKDDKAALAEGVNQFKVTLEQLRDAVKSSEWAKANCLIGVAGGEKDGTSGLREEGGAFDALRKELEAFADFIFSGNPKQAEFWLGRGDKSEKELIEIWRGKKPCFHGSDAHEPSKVGAPDKDRYCWIKGDLTFESLRQACMEPEGRAFIGTAPPRGGLPAHTIRDLSVRDAPWLASATVPLNPGLVAIIGARGSGKTALADMIAAGGYALSPHLNDRSFIQRAGNYLGEAHAGLKWEAGEDTGNFLKHVANEDLLDSPRVQYLSQQFVDQLCSSEGIDDALLREIERVVFNTHDIVDRGGATNFRELLEQKTETARAQRARHLEALARAGEELTQERARRASKPGLEKQRDELAAAIVRNRADRQALIGKGEEARSKQYEETSAAVEAARLRVDAVKQRGRQLLRLREEVTDIRDARATGWLADLQALGPDVGFKPDEWDAFRLRFAGDVGGILEAHIAQAKKKVSELQGESVTEPLGDSNQPPQTETYLPQGVPLADLTLSLLLKEQGRLALLVGIDSTNARKLADLSERITRQEAALEKVKRDIERAADAETRITELMAKRMQAYGSIFGALVNEEQILADLYSPLAKNLAGQAGSLQKLTFSVRRIVDVEAWANAGEALLDLRVQGPFKGKGSLAAAARAELLPAWDSGSAEEVTAAMTKFRDAHEKQLIEHAPVPKTDREQYRAWARNVSEWLYSTDHIKVSYSLQYDGASIEQLSPGTRGIVLLLLYLAIDGADDRPLIIDQPEENLDPQSIYHELVHRFKEAKTRRQIIIVTHNANLVVNTDADQIIVASCGPHRPGQLPEITYESGGLENPSIRRQVCDVLEGGELAFRERAKRLRVSL